MDDSVTQKRLEQHQEKGTVMNDLTTQIRVDKDKGYSNVTIAQKHNLSESTVRAHLKKTEDPNNPKK